MRLRCTVNGERARGRRVWEGESLLYVLRERLGLPGFEERLRAGRVRLVLGVPRRRARVLVPGRSPRRPRSATILTVEGSPTADELHPVQQAFVDAGAVQCGFCTPGLIVAAHDLLRRTTARPTDAEIREALAGNVCRCTGYEKILDAVRLRRASAGRRHERARRLEGCAVACVDAAGTEHAERPRRRRGRRDRRGRRRAGAAGRDGARRVDGARAASPRRGSSTATTTSTSGPPAAWPRTPTLFEWLVDAVPGLGPHRRGDRCAPRPRAGLAALALLGLHAPRPTTTTSSRAAAAICWTPRSTRRASSGCASTPPAARWTSARSQGGLPPDEVVEDRDAILAASEAAIDRFHDPVAGRDAADRARALLAVLGHRRS